MFLVLKGLEVNNVLYLITIIVNEASNSAGKCIDHLLCSPGVLHIGNLRLDSLEN